MARGDSKMRIVSTAPAHRAARSDWKEPKLDRPRGVLRDLYESLFRLRTAIFPDRIGAASSTMLCIAVGSMVRGADIISLVSAARTEAVQSSLRLDWRVPNTDRKKSLVFSSGIYFRRDPFSLQR